MSTAITQSPTNGSATDGLLRLVGGIVDTAGQVAVARVANRPAPEPTPTSAPRLEDPAARALPPAAPVAAPMPNQWKLWIGGSVAIGAVIAFALLAVRRPRGA